MVPNRIFERGKYCRGRRIKSKSDESRYGSGYGRIANHGDKNYYRLGRGKAKRDLRYEIVAEAHRGLAHLGIDKTLQKGKEYY